MSNCIQQKGSLGSKVDDPNAKSYVENFASRYYPTTLVTVSRVFDVADNEDRAGKANKYAWMCSTLTEQKHRKKLFVGVTIHRSTKAIWRLIRRGEQ